MGKVLTITRRELGAYFGSPLFWILAAAYLFMTGLVFMIYISSPNTRAEMSPLLGLQGTVLLFVTPVLAMRLIAEERKTGTLELLMTSPIADWQVVWGKWLAAFLTLVTMEAFTLLHVVLMSRLATNGMDVGPMLSNYLGLFLLGGGLLALGILTSAATDSQVTAVFIGIILVLVLWFVGVFGNLSASSTGFSRLLGQIGLHKHYTAFGDGTLDTRHIIYFVSLTLGCLFLSTRLLESRRWR